MSCKVSFTLQYGKESVESFCVRMVKIIVSLCFYDIYLSNRIIVNDQLRSLMKLLILWSFYSGARRRKSKVLFLFRGEIFPWCLENKYFFSLKCYWSFLFDIFSRSNPFLIKQYRWVRAMFNHHSSDSNLKCFAVTEFMMLLAREPLKRN